MRFMVSPSARVGRLPPPHKSAAHPVEHTLQVTTVGVSGDREQPTQNVEIALRRGLGDAKFGCQVSARPCLLLK
jgi:hypothetical protein